MRGSINWVELAQSALANMEMYRWSPQSGDLLVPLSNKRQLTLCQWRAAGAQSAEEKDAH
jgi:hypothetical protein